MSQLWKAGLGAIVLTILGNLLVYGVGLVLGVPFVIQDPSGALGPLPVAAIVVASTIPLVGATLLFWLLGKFLSRPILVFWVISAIVFVLSFGGPFSLPAEVALSTKIGLSVMHVVAAAVAVGVLTTLGREK